MPSPSYIPVIKSATPGDLSVGGSVNITPGGAINFGNSAGNTDTDLYRSGVNSLTTDGNLNVGMNLMAQGNAFGIAQPKNNNLVAWSADPSGMTNSTALSTGIVYLAALYISQSVSVTKLYWHVGNSAVTPTAGQNFVGLYNSSGVLMTSVGVDSDITTTGLKTATVTAQNLSQGSFYWMAWVFNAATAPGMPRGTGISAAQSMLNVGLSPASYRCAQQGSGLTALPASFDPSTNSGGILYFCALGA